MYKFTTHCSKWKASLSSWIEKLEITPQWESKLIRSNFVPCVWWTVSAEGQWVSNSFAAARMEGCMATRGGKSHLHPKEKCVQEKLLNILISFPISSICMLFFISHRLVHWYSKAENAPCVRELEWKGGKAATCTKVTVTTCRDPAPHSLQRESEKEGDVFYIPEVLHNFIPIILVFTFHQVLKSKCHFISFQF